MINKSINDTDALVIFRVGPIYCCAPTMAVISIIVPPEFTALPGVSSAEPGIFKSAHGIVHVVDLRRRFGAEVSDSSPIGRIIVAEVENGRDGFWVDEIIDVIQFPMSGWGVVPSYIPKDVFLKTLMLNNIIHLYTEFDCLHNLKVNGLLREHIAILKREAKNVKEKEAEVDEIPVPDPETGSKENISLSETKLAGKDDGDKSSGVVDMAVSNKAWQKHGAKILEKSTDGFVSSGDHLSECRLPEHIKKTVDRSIGDRRHDAIVPGISVSKATEAQDSVSPLIMDKQLQDNFTRAGIEKNDSVYLFVFAVFAICIITIMLMLNLPDYKMDDISPGTGDALIDSGSDENEVDRKDFVNKDRIVNQLPESLADVNHAELQKDAEGITIIVNEDFIDDAGPESTNPVESVIISNAVVDATVSEPDNYAGNLAINEAINASLPVVDEQVESRTLKDEYNTKVILHIVKKGDTLWHIALRYINNPYRYPELARLSKINNPDRIYPGNRVKIIIKTRKK